MESCQLKIDTSAARWRGVSRAASARSQALPQRIWRALKPPP
ncbi:hypothetical protein ACU4HD_13720 [Cupriavidus basilensis]